MSQRIWMIALMPDGNFAQQIDLPEDVEIASVIENAFPVILIDELDDLIKLSDFDSSDIEIIQ